MSKKKKNRNNKYNNGFSNPGVGPLNHFIPNIIGIKGHEKKKYFNQISMLIIFGIFLMGLAIGFNIGGFFGGIIGFILFCSLISQFITNRNYYR